MQASAILAGRHALLEFSNADAMQNEVVFFEIAIGLARGQAFGEKDVLLLIYKSIGDLHRSRDETIVRGVQASLFAQLATRKLFCDRR